METLGWFTLDMVWNGQSPLPCLQPHQAEGCSFWGELMVPISLERPPALMGGHLLGICPSQRRNLGCPPGLPAPSEPPKPLEPMWGAEGRELVPPSHPVPF